MILRPTQSSKARTVWFRSERYRLLLNPREEDETLNMNSTYELIAATANRVPEQIALQFLPQADLQANAASWSYRELFEQINRFANWLHAAGVGSKDVVSIVLPNLPQFHFAFWGAEAGAIANPINPMLDETHMAAIMQKVESKVLVTLAPGADPAAWEKTELLARQVPSLKHILTIDPAPFNASAVPTQQPGYLARAAVADFDRTIAEQPSDRLLSGRQFQASDIASYFHTGGTTGIPKVAQHSHGNEVAMAQSLAKALEIQDGKFLCGLPLFHVNGITVTGSLPFLLGGSVLLMTAGGYRGKGVFQNFWKLIERYQINLFSGVPTVYSSLLELPISGADLSSLRYGICGAAPLSPELMRRFESATGIKLLEGYGLTEATCASTLNPIHGERCVGSIGQQLPGIEVKAVELDGSGNYLRDCADDVVGQLVIRGATVFPGYLDAANNHGLFVDGSWVKTGDLGRRDSNGFFWLAGRAKDLIIRGGHNIDPASIEEALQLHPAVALVAAVGRPDAHAGELPVAYVELRQGHSATQEQLQAHAAAHIAEKAAIPKAITIVERMPLTAVGKIFKPALVWRETEEVFGLALSAIAGISSFRVKVDADARYGALAKVDVIIEPDASASTARESIQLALGRFTTRFELNLESAAQA